MQAETSWSSTGSCAPGRGFGRPGVERHASFTRMSACSIGNQSSGGAAQMERAAVASRAGLYASVSPSAPASLSRLRMIWSTAPADAPPVARYGVVLEDSNRLEFSIGLPSCALLALAG